MANFTVSHTTNSGARPEEYLVHDVYGQTIRFEIAEITATDAYEIDKVVAYQDVEGVRVNIAEFSNAASQIFPSGQNIFSGVLNANELYTNNGIGTVNFIAYDAEGNEIGWQTQAINTITLPEWAKGDDVKIENFVFLDDGTFQCTVTTTAFECTSEWFPDLQLGGEVFSSSVLDPKIGVETTAEVTYNGFDYEYKTVSTGLGLGGFLFSDSGMSENISTTVWLDNGDNEGWYLDKSLTFSDNTLSFSFKNDGLFSFEKPLFSTGLIPVPGLPWCQFSFDLIGSVSIPAEVSVNLGKNFSVTGSIAASAEITGKAGLGLGVSLAGFGINFGINLIEAGAWGSGSISVGGNITTNFIDEVILTPAKIDISLAAGAYIDALTIKVKAKNESISSTAGGIKITLAQWDYSLGASAFIGGVKTEESTATLIADAASEWQEDGSCRFTANIHAPLDNALKYYDLVLRYAEYDTATGEIIGEVKSEYVDKIYSNACFVADKTLNLDDSKTYMYNFVILPDQQWAYENKDGNHEISVYEKTNFLSCSKLQTTGVTVSVDKVSIKEPDYDPNASTVKEAEFTVKLSRAVDYDVKIAWFTSENSAKEGTDFVSPEQSICYVTIEAGETEASFSVNILGDNIKEDDEKFYVQMYVDGEAKDKVVFSSCNLLDYSGNNWGYTECQIIDSGRKGAAAVTVIDVSGSMSGSKLAEAKNAANTFIDGRSEGDYIGVVSFDSYAAVNYPLTQITGNHIKNNAISAVNSLQAGGGTFIGSGIAAAGNMLANVDATSKTIIAMTDGEDGNPDATRNIVLDLLDSGITIHGIELATQRFYSLRSSVPSENNYSLAAAGSKNIAYSSNKSLMEEITEMTGGKYYYAATEKDLEDIYFELSTRTSNQQFIVNSSSQVQADYFVINNITVDSSCTSVRLGIDLEDEDLDVVLWDPYGNYYDATGESELVKYTSTDRSKYYEITAPTKGVWGLGVVGKGTEPDSVKYDYYAIAASGITADLEFDIPHAAVGQMVALNCTVKDNEEPVTGASVYANVVTPDDETFAIQLFDDGQHGDKLAGDGIYGNFMKEEDAGVYKVTGFVEGSTMLGDSFFRQTVEEQLQIDARMSVPEITVESEARNGKTTILTASVDDGSALFYNTSSYDYEGTWTLYSSPIKVREDATYFFQATNAAGNTNKTFITVETSGFTGDDPEDLIFVKSNYSERTTGKKQNGVLLEYGENAFSSIDEVDPATDKLIVSCDSKVNGNEYAGNFLVAACAAVPSIREDRKLYSYKAASKARGILSITEDTGETEFIRFATVSVRNAAVGDISGGKESVREETKNVVSKKGTVTDTEKSSYSSSASGKFTAQKGSAGNVSGYSTVNLTDVTVNSVQGGTVKEDISNKSVEAENKVQKVISASEDYSASGKITLSDAAFVQEIDGYSKVVITESGAGNITNFISQSSKKENAAFDERKETVSRKITLTDSQKSSGELRATEAELGNVTGFSTVTLKKVGTAGDFRRVDEDGNDYCSVKETLSVKTNKDKSVSGSYCKTETFVTGGKFTATDSNVGDIENFSNVTLDGTEAAEISNILTSKIVTKGTADWSSAELYGRPDDYDLGLSDFDLTSTVTESLKGSVTLKNGASAESIVNFKTVTMADSSVGAINNVSKVTVKKGDSFIGSYTGTDANDTFSIAKGAVLTAGSIDLGNEAKDKLSIAGTLILTGTEVNAAKITGKGEIAANSDIYADLDIDFVKLLDLGETAENFRGTAYENADDTWKKAVKWDGENEYSGWMGDWEGYKSGSDTTDHIRFKAEAGDILEIEGIVDGDWTLLDKKGNKINSDSVLDDNCFTATGEYILQINSDEEKSFAYSIELA